MVIVRFVWFPVQGFKGIAMFLVASIGLLGHCGQLHLGKGIAPQNIWATSFSRHFPWGERQPCAEGLIAVS